MSSGTLTATALSDVVENTLALASLNFDFSLVKVQVPPEYREVGLLLSEQRSKDAETGLAHITARKLGALFEELIPKTPNLLSAYGLRASEIVASPAYNPKGSCAHGIFADHIGADGTTIWAAATSGGPAIAMHFLACMLARIWSPPEAISVWAEVVAERKRVLFKLTEDDPLNTASLATAHISLSRCQLAKWDAAARAWLLTADEVYKVRQKQLLLIINNIGIPVNMESGVYGSVIHAWRSALMTVEKLLVGEAQSIHIGAPLLGLSSWHLYPDMLILGETTKIIKQEDQLVPPGGIVTLGLRNKNSVDTGIYWSLPLAYLRFYGDPVVAKRRLSLQTCRVSMGQLLQIAVGSFVNDWCRSTSDLAIAAETLMFISKIMINCSTTDRRDMAVDWSTSWLQTLGSTSTEFMRSIGQRRAEYLQLMKSGRRRYSSFLVRERDTLPPVFGLVVPQAFLAVLREPDARVHVLREIASKITAGDSRFVIQYKVDERWECATALPITKRWGRASESGDRIPQIGHARWIQSPKAASSWKSLRRKKIPKAGLHYGAREMKLRLEKLQKMGEEVVAVKFEAFPPFRSLEFLFGDPENAALYAVGGGVPCVEEAVPLHTIKRALERDLVSPAIFERWLLSSLFTDPKLSRILISLRALSTVAGIYESLPEATIPLQVANQPIHRGLWIPHVDRLQGSKHDSFRLNLRREFACITLFESGGFNLDPDSLREVMAMSSGNSLYIPKRLLCDPWKGVQGTRLERIIGSLGRAGIAMMVPPRNPRMRELDHDSWATINHNKFDGKSDDCFQQTSLHLTFTDYELPIDVGSHGMRDSEIFFLEAPVSVHDRGEWVGDVNVLKCLSDPRLRRVATCLKSHDAQSADSNVFSNFVTIDNWEELLESPTDTAVVRAHGNWQARLAATALSVQRGHQTRILPEKVCWQCCIKQYREGDDLEEDGNPGEDVQRIEYGDLRHANEPRTRISYTEHKSARQEIGGKSSIVYIM